MVVPPAYLHSTRTGEAQLGGEGSSLLLGQAAWCVCLPRSCFDVSVELVGSQGRAPPRPAAE